MGFSHDKIFRIILFAALFLTFPLFGGGSNSGMAATLVDLTLPHYKDGKDLQFILYGERAVNLGATITIYNPLIDIVSRKLPDVEVIVLMKGVKSPDPKVKKWTKLDPKRVYPLYTDYRLIREFWKRIPHSEALIVSGDAIYDKNKRTMTGEGNIHFRSRDLDIDGTGFSANQEAKFIQVRRNVRVEYRPYARELSREADKLLEKKWNQIKNKNER